MSQSQSTKVNNQLIFHITIYYIKIIWPNYVTVFLLFLKVQKLVTADGTYATQSAFDSAKPASNEAGSLKDDRERPPLRKFLLDGDFFVGAALAGTLTKLALRFAEAVASEAKGQIKANR